MSTETISARQFRSIAASLIGVAVGFALGTITAEAKSYPEFVKKACKSDFKAYCRSYDIDSSAMRACMRRSVDMLSQRCIDALEKSGERRRGRD